jgi:hypothetical protein
MEWLNELPDLLRWAIYGVALIVLARIAWTVLVFAVVLLVGVFAFVGASIENRRIRKYQAQRKAREQAEYERRRAERGY